MTAAGDCFDAAYLVAEALVADGPLFDPTSGVVLTATEVYVAHGLPIGRGDENLGRRFWHGWVEALTPRGWLVVDLSNGQRTAIRRATYYRLGQLDPDAQVWRYTFEEAAELVRSTGHTGPWEDVPDDFDVAHAGEARP